MASRHARRGTRDSRIADRDRGHVLPRHRLLLEAGGFEGFRLAHVELLVDDQLMPERANGVLPQGHLHARGAPAHPQVEQEDYALPGVYQYSDSPDQKR